MDTAAVAPLYRGHHLQDRMMEVCEEEMKKRGMRYLLATVHPDNPYSLSNVQKRVTESGRRKKNTADRSAIFFVRKYKPWDRQLPWLYFHERKSSFTLLFAIEINFFKGGLSTPFL